MAVAFSSPRTRGRSQTLPSSHAGRVGSPSLRVNQELGSLRETDRRLRHESPCEPCDLQGTRDAVGSLTIASCRVMSTLILELGVKLPSPFRVNDLRSRDVDESIDRGRESDELLATLTVAFELGPRSR